MCYFETKMELILMTSSKNTKIEKIICLGKNYWNTYFIILHPINAKLYYCDDSELKTSGACFFNAPTRINRLLTPRSRTAPADYYFFVPTAKYLDEFFPDPDRPEGIHFKPRYTRHLTDRTGARTVGNKCVRVSFHHNALQFANSHGI